MAPPQGIFITADGELSHGGTGFPIGPLVQPVEIRPLVRPSPDRFPVDDAGTEPEGQEGVDNLGILGCPVLTPASVEADPLAESPGNQPVAIVLNLMTHAEPPRGLLGEPRGSGISRCGAGVRPFGSGSGGDLDARLGLSHGP
jgi:hypothetical protein